MTAALKIGNRDARRLLLDAVGLTPTPVGTLDLAALIRQIGFVQLDTIQVVSRAHHHIIWSRNQNYRERMLDAYLAKHRQGFEHFTHDASLIPMDFYPMWTRQFERMAAKVRNWGWAGTLPGASDRKIIRDRIANEGPLSTRAFRSQAKTDKQMWDRPPHKRALEYMWYAGELATSHRENFIKFYDLAERVIPAAQREALLPAADQVDWLCWNALERLAFASAGQIQRFWDAVDNQEARSWLHTNEDRVRPVLVEDAQGQWVPAFAPADVDQRLATVARPTSRLRILNPFDPLVRDRERAERLFGFHYRVEMFVPAAKRRWGYYIYPLLEGDRFVGRLEVKAERRTGQLVVSRLWQEPGVTWTDARYAKLEAELSRLARLAAVEAVVWTDSA